MRRRVDESVPPADLLAFDGARYPRYVDWVAALAEWRAVRRKWASDHGISEPDMPADIGGAPFDFEEMIGPVNLATHEVIRRAADGTPTYIRRRD